MVDICFRCYLHGFLDRVCLVGVTFFGNLVPVHILGHLYLGKVLSLLSVGEGKKCVLSTA